MLPRVERVLVVQPLAKSPLTISSKEFEMNCGTLFVYVWLECATRCGLLSCRSSRVCVSSATLVHHCHRLEGGEVDSTYVEMMITVHLESLFAELRQEGWMRNAR